MEMNVTLSWVGKEAYRALINAGYYPEYVCVKQGVNEVNVRTGGSFPSYDKPFVFDWPHPVTIGVEYARSELRRILLEQCPAMWESEEESSLLREIAAHSYHSEVAILDAFARAHL